MSTNETPLTTKPYLMRTFPSYEELGERLVELRVPFPSEQIGKLPRGGTTLDYVGHGAVRARLLDVDPLWNWEPVAYDQDGEPRFNRTPDDLPIGLWIKLTVCGVTRLGYGSCKEDQWDAEKVLIGDAIRNAAMSFGVALDLWIKGGDREEENARPAKRSGPPQCVVCDKPITGKAVKGGGGWAHEECVTPAEDTNTEPF